MLHQHAVPHQQGVFRQDVLNLIQDAEHVAFFVDDQIFIRPWRVLEVAGLSLRLGLHLTQNYNSNDAPQPLPPYQMLDDGRVMWRWSEGVMAWGYPVSVDGHLYEMSMLRSLIESVAFHSPNTLETALQQFAHLFIYGTCYQETKVVNIPWTCVQTDWNNRHVGLHADALLSSWEHGSRIDVRALYGVHNTSVHQEFPLLLEDCQR